MEIFLEIREKCRTGAMTISATTVYEMGDHMGASQKVQMEWETPSSDEIVEISKAHVAGLEATNDDAVWRVAGMHHILLYTIGRKSGNAHNVALPVWRDPEGHRIVVGSFAGATRDPAWVQNLRDRQANPRVKVRSQDGLFWSEQEIIDSSLEHEELWTGLLEDRDWYANYQAKTDRVIPLVRLPESETIQV